MSLLLSDAELLLHLEVECLKGIQLMARDTINILWEIPGSKDLRLSASGVPQRQKVFPMETKLFRCCSFAGWQLLGPTAGQRPSIFFDCCVFLFGFVDEVQKRFCVLDLVLRVSFEYYGCRPLAAACGSSRRGRVCRLSSWSIAVCNRSLSSRTSSTGLYADAKVCSNKFRS